MAQEPNLVRNMEDMARLDGQSVVAIGQYEAITKPMKGKPKKELPKDHALLRLGDGTRVYLEALDSNRAQRRQAELDQFNGQQVYVAGIAHKQMPARGAGLIAPCLSEISEIRKAGPEAEQ